MPHPMMCTAEKAKIGQLMRPTIGTRPDVIHLEIPPPLAPPT